MPKLTGIKLKFIRESLKLDRKIFSDFFGINVRRYEEYETGRRCMNIQTLRHIADKLDISIDFLMCRSDFIILDNEKDIMKRIANRIKLS
ncbi:helix-turn-helix domain-containing protein [Tepidibacter mesophilus]|uniref:helix-turn-helix domain-containing protein n=1 Tax=Tepidibacter mesophilus TaxID=655607 RepID=UPI000C075368|nr:helix-turn-helix transcriptional regulator [Tepidibacter mesophilus]